MHDEHASAIRLNLCELRDWERSHASQAAALARLRDAAVGRQLAHLLTDPVGRVLAVATIDGTIHMLDATVLPPNAYDLLDDAEIVESSSAPGFHANRSQTFYVTQRGAVYRLRAPGQWSTLQRLRALPDDCEEIDLSACDAILCLLAETADALDDEEPLPLDDLRRDSSCTEPPPTAPPAEAETSYVRVDDVFFQVTVDAEQEITVASSSAGLPFRVLGRGRWDGARIVEFSATLTFAARDAIESALRRRAVDEP